MRETKGKSPEQKDQIEIPQEKQEREHENPATTIIANKKITKTTGNRIVEAVR